MPDGLVIAEKENEVEIEVSAADDAKVGEVKNVRVSAKAELAGGPQKSITPDATLNILEKS